MSATNKKSNHIHRSNEGHADNDRNQNRSQNYDSKKQMVPVSDQINSIERFRMTETIVAPFTTPILPPITRHNYSTHGADILLVSPTLNKFKTKLLEETFTQNLPHGHTLHIVSNAFDSDVGEQPYNSAGFEGAHNRITNALRHFDDPANQGIFREHKIGTVIFAAIENFVQIEDVAKPTDYGVAALYNAMSGKMVSCLSQGVTVPRKYLDQARVLGFDDGCNHGRVSVGKVFAEQVPGIDHANWHEVVSGRSRYDILTKAVRGLDIPW